MKFEELMISLKNSRSINEPPLVRWEHILKAIEGRQDHLHQELAQSDYSCDRNIKIIASLGELTHMYEFIQKLQRLEKKYDYR